MHQSPSQHRFWASLFAVATLVVLVIYGLIIRPMVQQVSAMPLELVFLTAAIVVIAQLLLLGFDWLQIQQAIAAKLSQAIPTLLILFAIGLLIGSWIIAGTIPMLVYYGLALVDVEHFYLIAFITPIGFSLCTGTSWGSIATIGLVLITVAHVINVDLAITTGAIVGGAYFGDKLSPLSDTTNIAAIAVGVPLYSHIRAMMDTTLPSAILAAGLFFLLDWFYPPQIAPGTVNMGLNIDTGSEINTLSQTMAAIRSMFAFNPLLLLPPIIVLLGAAKRFAPLPVLVVSSMVALLLAMVFQPFDFSQIIETAHRGFNIEMVSCLAVKATDCAQMPEHIAALFNRGGLYALVEPIVITLMVFIYVGAIDCIDAMATLIKHLLAKIQRVGSLIAASLVASAFTNAMTSSQYANSFIVGDAFAQKYDALGVPRTILSRSLEDTGTMIESLVPWSTTAVFVYATLGVSVQQYWQWQLLSLINIPMAFGLAFLAGRRFKPSANADTD